MFWASPDPPASSGQPEKTFPWYAGNPEGSLLPEQDSMDYEQMLFAQSQRCPMDAAGRVRFLEMLLDRFNLSGSVIVLGVKDHLEVVDPDTAGPAAGWRNDPSFGIVRGRHTIDEGFERGDR